MPPPLAAIRWRRYVVDRDVWHAAAVTATAMLLSAGLVWLAYLVHVVRTAWRSPLQPPRPMVLLVFGRRLDRNRPVPDYRRRLARTLALAQQRLTDRVLLLGGTSSGSVSEAAAGHRWLQQHAWPAAVSVELEQASTDSLENLRHARTLLKEDAADERLPPVALVSSRYHLARCQLLARRLGFVCFPVAAEPQFRPRPRECGRLLLESGYVMALDLGLRWAALIGHRRMSERVR